MDFAPENRERVQRFWAAPAIAEKPGLKAVDLFRAVGEGRIKALWVMATNPAVSMPDANRVREALAACPFVVVSDVIEKNATGAFAHRSEERRVGKEGVRQCRSRGSPYH